MKSKLLKAFKKILNPEQILCSATELKIYDTDATALFKNKAYAVLIPTTVTQIQEIIKAINIFNEKYQQNRILTEWLENIFLNGAVEAKEINFLND